MAVRIITDAEIMRDAAQILLEHLPPTKVARFWANWHIGQGDYLDWRDEIFAQTQVEDLYDEVLAFQQDSQKTSFPE